MSIDRSGQLAQNLETLINQSSDGLDTTQVANLLNEFLSEEEKLVARRELDSPTFGIFKRFGEFDKIAGKVEVVTEGLWTGGAGSLTAFFTSSAQATSDAGAYYLEVYQEATSSATAAVQFCIAYGHKTGGGWSDLVTDDDTTLPTQGTYSQYRNILLDPTDEYFTFLSSSAAGEHDSDDIYVINVGRARYREKMDPGNLYIELSGSSGLYTFIDDSGQKLDNTVGRTGRVYNIVSGALNPGSPTATISSNYASNGEGYGLFYPDVGIIVLNPSALADTLGAELTPTVATDADYNNHWKLYNALVLGADFESRLVENVSTAHYFVRVRNREFNFSNNPTFVSGSTGQFRVTSFEKDPKVYITTVGLYNDANELLAVAKTSQPLMKSFSREILVRCKLDF